MIEEQKSGSQWQRAFNKQKGRDYWLNRFVEAGILTKAKAEKAKKLIYNEILGPCTPKDVDDALKMGAIKKRKVGNVTRYTIATEEKIIGGEKVTVVSQKYLDLEEKRRKRRAANLYKEDEIDSIIKQEIDKFFPGSYEV